MNKIYLDNSATTSIDPRVFEAMKPFLTEVYGNPSSVHSFGREARSAVDKSREFVSFFIGCKPTEVIFTSGGSESDNLAIRGVIEAMTSIKYNVESIKSGSKPHVITTAIEHHAVLHTIQDMEKEGKIAATYIKPQKNGIVAAKDVVEAIRSNTVLVSVMYVNNEIGTAQPIREIGLKLKEINKDRKDKIYFHTDAVQAGSYFQTSLEYLNVDLLTMTAHKVHGPKGVGVLVVKSGTPLNPIITGGEHEFGLRAGTENVAGIVGFAAALESILKRRADGGDLKKNFEEGDSRLPVFWDDEVLGISKLRDKLESEILKRIPDSYVNGDKELRAPNITNISFKNAEGEAIILNLDFLGIAVSSGSACTARSLEPSHVLLAMDIPHELTHGAIRFSLSKYTTEAEIDKVIEVLPGIIEKLREMSPF